MLHLILGSTIYAVTLVLIAFMSGLALGSWLVGRSIDRSDKALKIYALLEAGVGLFALFSPILLGLINPLYVRLCAEFFGSQHLLHLIKFMLAFMVLAIPATLMGATLPVISKYVVREKASVGTDLAYLYGFNTLGATLGCFITGFILIHAIGIVLTIMAAAILNLLVAVSALLLARGRVIPIPPAPPSEPPENIRPRIKTKDRSPDTIDKGDNDHRLRLVLIMFGLSGFISLGYEVLWFKAISFFAGNTSYAFSTMLTTFLSGIGLGSLLATRFSDKLKRPLLGFGLAEIMIGICAIATIPMFARYFYLLRPEIYGENTATPIWMKFVFSFLAMFLPTLLMGAVFPIVGRIYTRGSNKIGRSIGNLYSLNTVGSILGSAAAGFILVPLVGIPQGILILALMQIAIGLIMIMACRGIRLTGKFSLAAAFVLLTLALVMIVPVGGNTFSSARRPHMPKGSSIYYEEGICNIVEVIQENENVRHLIIDGGVNSSTSPHGVGLRIHRLMSQLPLLLHKNPQSILLIALGSGTTAGATLAFSDLKTIDCVEISQDVVNTADLFKRWNHDVVNSPRFNLIIEDGRNFVLTAPRKYDVITAGIIHPKYNPGNAGFYNRDFYEICKSKLNRGGIICQWAPLYGLTVEEFKMVIRTFLDVFPHASLWLAQNYGQMGNSNALLIGSPDGLEFSYAGLQERLRDRDIAEDMREEGIDGPIELLDCFVIGERLLRDFVSDGTDITTDNHPVLEFGRIGMEYDKLLKLLAELREPVWPWLADLKETAVSEASAVRDSLIVQYDISNYCLQSDLLAMDKDYNLALAEFGKALEIQPQNQDIRPLYRELQLKANNSLIREFAADNQGNTDLIKRFSQRLQYKPDDAESQFKIGVVYQQKGWFDAALTQYRDALRLSPDNPFVEYNLAVLYDRIGETEKALDELEKVTKIEPTMAAAFVQLGTIHKRIGNQTQARDMFLKALALDPKNETALEQLSDMK